MDEAEEEFEELARVLDKEEKEMDEADDEDNEESETLERDVEKIEEAMKEEIKGVSKIAKPVCQVPFKVSTLGPESLDPSVLGLLAFFLFASLFFTPGGVAVPLFCFSPLASFLTPFFLASFLSSSLSSHETTPFIPIPASKTRVRN